MNPDKKIIFAAPSIDRSSTSKSLVRFNIRLIKVLVFIFFVSLLTFDVSHVYAQQPTQEWVQRFSGNGNASGLSVKLDSMGNVYVLMKLSSDTSSGNFGLNKYLSTGNLLWSRNYNGSGNTNDAPKAFVVTKAGDIYITGTSDINLVSRITTVKYNNYGALQWAKVYDGGGPGDGVYDIALDKNDNVIIAGGSQISGSLSIALTIKYNPSGDSMWVKKFTGLGQIYSVNSKSITDDSNNIYTAGYVQGDYLIIKYNTNGNLQWYTTYDSPQHYNDAVHCLAMDNIRNVYVVGTTFVPSNQANNTLLKISSGGIIQWSRIFSGIISGNGHCGEPAGIVVTPDGNSIFYTTSCDNGSSYEIVTLKYDSTGDSLWVRRYGGGINYSEGNDPAAIKFDIYGSVYIAGIGYNLTSGNDYVTIKYLSNGMQQWLATYNGPLSNSDDGASDIVIDTALNVYVTGTSSRQNTPQYLIDAATIKYNQPIGILNNSNNLPGTYRLFQNYPNPFNPTTVITYELPRMSRISLCVYNTLGQLVRELVNSVQNAGYYSIAINMKDLASGVYFYQLVSDGNIIDTKKLALIK